jgi:hypothetical protein
MKKCQQIIKRKTNPPNLSPNRQSKKAPEQKLNHHEKEKTETKINLKTRTKLKSKPKQF